jgi:hypothetical protein
MAENTKGRLLLEKKDFVAVVDAEGNDLGYEVPKHWGADQLAAGASFVKGKAAKKAASPDGGGSGSGSGGSGSGADPDAEPAKNASTEAWVEYATRVKGAGEDDLKGDDGEPLKREQLIEKYGTQAS